ncbi:MAG TPA: hypothetical protein VEP66_15485 [Myxococcales bacterium]|nr:hypothetical protein [Myxococcales bacterium]
MRTPALIALALLLAACPANLEEQSHVSKLRVLAVRADPPELMLEPDAGLPATTLTALAVEPTDAGISMRFALCLEITSAPDASLPCPGSAGLDLPATGPLSARLDLADPRLAALAAQTDAGTFDAGLDASIDQGIPLLIGFTARSEAQQLDGFATLILRSPARGDAGTNPPEFNLEVGDGGPIAPKQVVRLQPITPPKDDPTKAYGFSFFATAGSISSLRSTDTTATGQPAPTWVEWTAPESATHPVRFWVVLRDGRGGTAWVERSADVGP